MAKELCDWIKQRREEDLGISQAAAARTADVHRQTWRGWEQGATPEAHNYTAIERALQWERGSVRTILAGGEPTSLASSPPTKFEPNLDDPAEAAIWAKTILSKEERKTFILILRRRLAERAGRDDDDGEHRHAG